LTECCFLFIIIEVSLFYKKKRHYQNVLLCVWDILSKKKNYMEYYFKYLYEILCCGEIRCSRLNDVAIYKTTFLTGKQEISRYEKKLFFCPFVHSLVEKKVLKLVVVQCF